MPESVKCYIIYYQQDKIRIRIRMDEINPKI